MVQPVSVVVPRDTRFRGIVPELAGKYCSAAGGSEADASTVESAVSQAVDDVAAHADADDSIAIALSAPTGRVEVTLRCGRHASVVTHPLPADRVS